MRFHGTMGVDFGSIRVDGSGLSCDLKRTKVAVVKVFIGADVHLTHPTWFGVIGLCGTKHMVMISSILQRT